MALNPESNRFEMVTQDFGDAEIVDKFAALTQKMQLIRPNGEPVPDTWTTFRIGELVTIKNSTFRCAYIGETSVLFEPVKPTDALNQ